MYQDVGAGLDAERSSGWGPDAYIGNYGDNSLLYFNQYRTAQPGSPLYWHTVLPRQSVTVSVGTGGDRRPV